MSHHELLSLPGRRDGKPVATPLRSDVAAGCPEYDLEAFADQYVRGIAFAVLVPPQIKSMDRQEVGNMAKERNLEKAQEINETLAGLGVHELEERLEVSPLLAGAAAAGSECVCCMWIDDPAKIPVPQTPWPFPPLT